MHMNAELATQEPFDAYRYQLATMVYAIAVAHYHRLPILRSPFKALHRQLVRKMLHPHVWSYWFNTSHSGTFVDPDIKELRKPWADPVVRENIMYSGHLLLMVSLYAMLYDDDEFEHDGSLVFKWEPLFWGIGCETFSYSTSSLQDAILREMQRTEYVGVCCEPNMVFIVCNQFPIIAVRYNDVRHGNSNVEDLLMKYQRAWAAKGGFLAPNGRMCFAWRQKQDKVVTDSPGPGNTAWTSAFMNAWNSEFVHSVYDCAVKGHITDVDGQGFRLHPIPVGDAIRQLAEDEGLPVNDRRTLERAKTTVRQALRAPQPPLPPIARMQEPELGYVAQWLSELGKNAELKGVLEYADEQLHPTWEAGGLFYPRNDLRMNEHCEWTHVDPLTGNAGIAYARLNVEAGQKKMWEEPWTRSQHESRPWLDGLTFEDGVDFLRGSWCAEKQLIVLTLRAWDGCKRELAMKFRNLSAGVWHVFVDDDHLFQRSLGSNGTIELDVAVDGTEVDIQVFRVT